MSKKCPQCHKVIDEKNNFCSKYCFNEYHGQPREAPVGRTLRIIGVATESVE